MTGYEAPLPAGAAPARRGSGMAVAALVLGILAIVLSFTVIGGIVLGLLAVVLGLIASGRAKRGQAAGRGMAIAGYVTGAIGVLLAVGLVVLGVSLLNSPSGKTLQKCLKNAGSDQAAVQRCNDQFRNDIGK